MSVDPGSDLLAPLTGSIAEVREAVRAAQRRGRKVGFVPTMGALHAGHASLIDAARRECEFVVVSIFVNPTQFAPHEDLAKYPRPLAADRQVCRQAGADLVFVPRVEDIYPAGFTTYVTVEGLSSILEGVARPTHFRGVTTVVLKLFQMVPADIAYFGQKDYQQQTIIRKMVADLNLPITIRVCPTIRETDGLAMSSRNVYLNSEQRQVSLALFRTLEMARTELARGERNLPALRQRLRACLGSDPAVQPDYATLVDPDTLAELDTPGPRVVALVAARVGTTRLIDNAVIDLR